MSKDHVFKKLLKNSGTIFLGNSAASALNMVSFSLMAKAVGAEFLAVYALSQTYANLVNDIFNVQTWEGLIKFGSTKLSDDEMASLIKTNIVIDSISALVAFVFALLLALPVTILAGWDRANIPIISLYSISILFNSTTLTIGIPRLMREFSGVAKIQIGVSVIRLLSVGLCYFLGGASRLFISIYLCMDILTNIGLICFSVHLVKQKLGSGWWSKKLIFNREQISFIWWSNLRTIIRIPVRHFDVIVISSVISMEALGAYKVYKEITKVISNVSDPVSQAIFPEFTKLIGTENHNESVALARKSMFAMSIVAIALSVFLCLISEIVVKTFFGHEFLIHMNILYLMIVITAFAFSTTPINSLFIAAGFAKASFYVVLITNSVYLLMAFWCGSVWGLLGIVLANAVQFVLNKELKVFILKRAGRWTVKA
ncbi:MAG: oligosaccharide flippase family protein [Geobacter sp.]|nr:oligosaccharide flippase family protein [Geobacter sp.]